jgi:peroxiredoxin
MARTWKAVNEWIPERLGTGGTSYFFFGICGTFVLRTGPFSLPGGHRMYCTIVGTILCLACGPEVGARSPKDEARKGAAESPQDRFAALVKAQQEASQRYHDEWDGAKDEAGRQQAIDRFLKEVSRNTDRALDLARERPEDPIAVEALDFVLRTAKAGPGPESTRAVEILSRDHVLDKQMGSICYSLPMLWHVPAAESLIRAVLERNPNHEERGMACHALARYLMYQSRMLRRLRGNPARIEEIEQTRGKGAVTKVLREKDAETLDKDAAAVLERVIADYGKVSVEGRTLADVAGGELYELRHLTVGKVAPEIEGKDVNGKAFKLSDYRGKVVVLTFSGNWCGPCRAEYPNERKLVERLREKRFVLLSVNTDEGKETLQKSIDSGEITWRCWVDGGTDGPITTAWGVISFPTFYVIDQTGVIRHKGGRDLPIGELVDALLDGGGS